MTDPLSIEGLNFFRLGDDGAERPILSDISWRVRAGEIAAVLGANGSGKSTLLRLAVGYLWPQRGKIRLLGETLGEVALAPVRARVGIVEANTIYPFDDAMRTADVVTSGYFSNLTLGYSHPTRAQVAHARHLVEQVGLSRQAGQLYHTLSTGQRMRALLARALVRQPELLLLDEPTAGLDLPAREMLLATLSRLHQQSASPAAMITVTHHLEELLPETRNVLLLSRQGREIAQGPPEDVLSGVHLSAAYGVPVHVMKTHARYSAHIDPATWDELLK